MAIREIKYTVDTDGITPSVIQNGGIQGDHNATEILFSLSTSLWNKLQSEKNQLGGNLLYRFDSWTSTGKSYSTEPKDLTGKDIIHSLQECLTRYAGKIKIVLVVTLYNPEPVGGMLTNTEIFACIAHLNIKALPGYEADSSRESISALARATKENAVLSTAAAKSAQEDRIKTENSMAHFKNGSTIVFLGGDAESSFNVDLAVDEILSNESENPVANKTVKQEFDNVLETVEANKQLAGDEVDELQAQLDKYKTDNKAIIKELGVSDKVTGEHFIDDAEIGISVNKWFYVKLSNNFFWAWGYFNIKPKESNEEGVIYTSEQITVPFPFRTTNSSTTVTGNTTFLESLTNLLIYPIENGSKVCFSFQRHQAGISLSPTRVYLQIIGEVA